MLEAEGISAERKSLYSDIDALRFFGLDIIQANTTRSASYYLGSRDFELPELKLMVDSIQTAKFVTHKKTMSLIKKIESLASIYDAQLLQRQVYVSNRIKHMNESIYYNMDEIYNGIMQNRKIRFHYFDYTVAKERHFRKDGDYYEISPFAMTWDDENYYLIAYDSEAGFIKHYRVDKMLDIEVTDGPEHFTFSADVAVSPQFFAWVTGFGASAKIIGPERVVHEMAEHIRSVAALYN